MVSTYYYIYILVDTYYVINGITIVKYLHTDNVQTKGVCQYIATLYPLENYKRGCDSIQSVSILRATSRHYMALVGAWTGDDCHHVPHSLADIEWVQGC